MTPSHGCAGVRGRSWWITALVASGFCLAVAAPRPANACHIHHDHEASTTSEASASATPSHAFPDLMKPWDEMTKAEPQVISPTAMPASTLSPPAMPSMATWHQTTANSALPPTPPSTCDGSMTTASAQSVVLNPPLNAPAVYLNPPTPAPEPSTIVSAIFLAGALAWRRRWVTWIR